MSAQPNAIEQQVRAEDWAGQIRAVHAKSVQAILETGLLLLNAKNALPHGEWGRLFNEQLIPFTQGTAERLMAIASHPVLSNSAHAPNLPPSWTTLYELSKLPEHNLRQAIESGHITPNLERKDVYVLHEAALFDSLRTRLTPESSEAERPHSSSTTQSRVDPHRSRVENWQEQYVEHRQALEQERQLAREIISAGYKVVARRLHPDVSSAKDAQEAMTQLNTVRDRLRQCVTWNF